MSNKLANLLNLIQEDESVYYVLRGRELYTEDNLEVLSNDKNSSKISILMPETINGRQLDSSMKFYIDFLDGNEKPGVISSENEIIQVIAEPNDKFTGNVLDIVNLTVEKSDTSGVYDIKQNGGILFSLTLNNDNTITPSDDSVTVISQNEVKKGDTTYYIGYNTKTKGYKTYDSLIKNENFEDSAEVSDDFPSAYAESTYFLRESKSIKVAGIQNNISDSYDVTKYSLLEWTLDPAVTEAVGKVTFSIRIESDNWKWQSETASFTVKSNLQEIYSLKKEIEENFVIQNRNIVPVGDFKSVLVKGDANSNKLFYKMNRYFQGQDMLARKEYTINSTKYELWKSRDKKTNTIYYLKNDSSYNYANFGYIINSLTLLNNKNSYIYNNGVIEKIQIPMTNLYVTYNNLSLTKEYNSTLSKYVFRLKYQFSTFEKKEDGTFTPIDNNPHAFYFCTFDSLDNVLKLRYNNNNTQFITCSPIWKVTANKYFLGDKANSPSGIIPMFNRLIRFVFLSPNKDYGDWNNGEIEYINEAENYFIFSWTPNARVTRMEGEVSYTIEFFINAFEEVLDENQNRVLSQTKAYSWSTLPTTIKVENNSAATASVDYIPNWVSFVENEMEPKLDEFLHNDLESKYDAFENEMKQRIFEGYNSFISEDSPEGQKTIEVGNDKYEIIIGTGETEPPIPLEITLNNMGSDDSGVSPSPVVYPLTPVANSDILYQSINCLLPSVHEDLGNYFMIFNDFTNQLILYIVNDSEQTPFFPYLVNRLEELISATKQQIYENYEEGKFTKLAETFGIESEEEEVSIETIFNQILTDIINKIFLNGMEDFNKDKNIMAEFTDQANDLITNLEYFYFGDNQEIISGFYEGKEDTLPLVNGKFIIDSSKNNGYLYEFDNDYIRFTNYLVHSSINELADNKELLEQIKVKIEPVTGFSYNVTSIEGEQPDDWANNYMTYYIKDDIKGFVQNNNSTWVSGKFYKLSINNHYINYYLITLDKPQELPQDLKNSIPNNMIIKNQKLYYGDKLVEEEQYKQADLKPGNYNNIIASTNLYTSAENTLTINFLNGNFKIHIVGYYCTYDTFPVYSDNIEYKPIELNPEIVEIQNEEGINFYGIQFTNPTVSKKIGFKYSNMKEIYAKDKSDMKNQLIDLFIGKGDSGALVSYTPQEEGTNIADKIYTQLTKDLTEKNKNSMEEIRNQLSYFLSVNEEAPEAFRILTELIESIADSIIEEDNEEENELQQIYEQQFAGVPNFDYNPETNTLLINFTGGIENATSSE